MMSEKTKRLEGYRAFAVKLTRAGSAISVNNFLTRHTAPLDPAEQQRIVKETNSRIEQLILGRVKEAFPNHAIINDTTRTAAQLKTGHPTWVVDYLDGEKNFSVGFPYFCCSAALYEDGIGQAGAVTDALHKETYSFAQGQGSFFNSQRFQTVLPADSRQAILSVAWADHTEHLSELNANLYARLAPLFPQQRRAGSIALDLCNIAAGRFGGMYAYDPVLVDLAAGLPIAVEAGCQAVNFDGRPYNFGDHSLIVAPEATLNTLQTHIAAISQLIVKSSLTHPLQIDFLPSSAIGEPGRLGLSAAPGRKDKGDLYSWNRDLTIDLNLISLVYKFNFVISFLEDQEYNQLDIAEYQQEAQKRGIETLRFPMADWGIPLDMNQVLTLVKTIVEQLANGKNVLMHCKQGVGRTGTIAACFLIYKGLSAEKAIALVQGTRHGVLRHEPQIKFVQDFYLWFRRHEQ